VIRNSTRLDCALTSIDRVWLCEVVTMRVVLVDGSRLVLRMVTQMLEARDHTVRTFTDGPEALACVKSDLTVDALITSAELSSMSGFELCWETRLLSTLQRPISIIMMSADYDRHKLKEALDSGADDFISKPPVCDELYARLRAAERMAAMQHELIRLATTDPLTGVLNRRAFFERAHEACARRQPSGNLSAIMIDIDHFKRVNDVYGHGAGDDVIRGLAQQAAAEPGIVGRLGGEEFAMLLEQRPVAEAMILADRLRLKFGALRFETDREAIMSTCSMGVAEWRAGDTVDTLLKRADTALYKAKADGRNRVIAEDPSEATGGATTGRIRSTPREALPAKAVATG
jgi:diguanylate cyclase (GGDEF)-like protein